MFDSTSTTLNVAYPIPATRLKRWSASQLCRLIQTSDCAVAFRQERYRATADGACRDSFLVSLLFLPAVLDHTALADREFCFVACLLALSD